MSRIRLAAATVALFLGLDLAVVTATVMRGKDGFDPMATAGPASIWSSIGLAFLAPVLIHAALGRPARSRDQAPPATSRHCTSASAPGACPPPPCRSSCSPASPPAPST